MTRITRMAKSRVRVRLRVMIRVNVVARVQIRTRMNSWAEYDQLSQGYSQGSGKG